MAWDLNGETEVNNNEMKFISKELKDLKVEITKVKSIVSKKNKEGVLVFFKVVEGPYKNEFITARYWNDPKCLFVMRRLAIACGFYETDENGKDHIEQCFAPFKLKGSFLGIDTKKTEYEGDFYYNVTNERDLNREG
jgi:hypothetical protein